MQKKYKMFSIGLFSSVCIFLILCFFIGHCIILHHDFKNVDAGSFWTHRWFQRKLKIAESKSKKGKKIIFLSGSNTLFGINTKKIEETIGIPTVNFGVHGGYPWIILEYGKKILKKGDILILPLEGVFYEKSSAYNVNNLIAPYIIFYRKDLYHKINFHSKIYCIRWLFYKYYFISKMSKDTYISSRDEYNDYNNWNNNGDVISVRQCKISKDDPCITGGAPIFTDEDMKCSSDPKFFLNEFIEYAKRIKVKIYFMAPVIMKKEHIADSSYESYVDYWKKLGIPYIGKIKESIYPVDFFFDTEKHLNTKGMRVRTNQIIGYLKDILL